MPVTLGTAMRESVRVTVPSVDFTLGQVRSIVGSESATCGTTWFHAISITLHFSVQNANVVCLIFSPHIGMGRSECYAQRNVAGDVYGNCGHTSTAYQRCASGYVCESSMHT